MKMINSNKGTNGIAITLLVILVALVAVIGGFTTNWYGLAPVAEEETQQQQQQQQQTQTTGKIATLKVSVFDNADTPNRYAGTAYCWDNSKPTELISGNSVSTSETAGTTVAPVNRYQDITCVAYDSSHYGVETPASLDLEANQLTLKTLNASTSKTIQFVEDGDTEAVGSIALTIAAGATDSYDSWTYKANTGDAGLNLKKVCVGSNSTNSEIASIEMDGFTTSGIPYRLRNSHDFCFEKSSATYIENYETVPFSTIRITTSGSFAIPETLNFSVIDEARYKSVDGSIKLGTQTDAPTPADVGVEDVFEYINVSAS
jgi:hypothetical protein